MSNKIIYYGWSTQNVTPSSSNTNLYDIDLVKQDILNEFMTKQGDRVMLPTFGSIIWDLLFDGMSEANMDLIADDAKRIVENDNRVNFQTMHIEEIDHGYNLYITATYVPLSVNFDMIVEFINQTNSIS